MEFKNEATYMTAAEDGRVNDFHARFDRALDAVEEDFGQAHPIYIDGKEVRCTQTFGDYSPSDRKLVLGHFQKAGKEDAAKAIQVAKAAFPDWSNTDWKDRVSILLRTADYLSEQKFELSALMCHENGKNRLEAMGDTDEAIDFLRWYSAEMERNDGFDKEMGRAIPEERTRSVLKPYGVWSIIAPFNFPLAITCGMTAGVIVTGNTAVLKPASDTPFIGLRLYEALQAAGLPDGVVNFLTGPGSTMGAEMVANPNVSGLVFTGSKPVGLSSFKALTEDFAKPVITELGGKNPVIVTEEADLDKAVPGVGRGAFGFGGQKCSATSRLYVHEKLKEGFLEKLIAWTEDLMIGDPWARDTYLGPLINESAYTSYQRYVSQAAKDGKILTGGHVLSEGPLGNGYFVDPTVVDGLPVNHALFREELFVPILCVSSISSLAEGLRLANDSEYGLCAGIFTESEDERTAFFREIQAGVAYSNRVQGATTGAIVGAQPFGGWKHSGISGKGAGGSYYLQQFLREQSQTYYR